MTNMLRGEHLTASSALRTRQESYGAGSGCCGADGAGAAVVGAANEQSVGLQNVSTFCCSCSWPAAANALSFCNLQAKRSTSISRRPNEVRTRANKKKSIHQPLTETRKSLQKRKTRKRESTERPLMIRLLSRPPEPTPK